MYVTIVSKHIIIPFKHLCILQKIDCLMLCIRLINRFLNILATFKILPGKFSCWCSLYFTPNVYADEAWWVVFSALSTSYEPGAT